MRSMIYITRVIVVYIWPDLRNQIILQNVFITTHMNKQINDSNFTTLKSLFRCGSCIGYSPPNLSSQCLVTS